MSKSVFSVSLVVPTFNGRLLLERHLPAMLACLRDKDELIIVDDASTDDSVAWLQLQFGLTEAPEEEKEFRLWRRCLTIGQRQIELVLVSNQGNVRFGASSNRGVEVATKDLIFLLNSDVSPHEDVLDFLVPHFQDSTVFAVGCHELEQGDKKISGGKNVLWFERGLFFHKRAEEFSTGDTAWASGGSSLFDRAKWLQLGGFDALFYPAYWEDIDLSYRARQRGWKVLFEERALVDHNHETTNKSVFGERSMVAMSWRNAQRFAWRHATLPQKLQFLWWWPYHSLKMWQQK